MLTKVAMKMPIFSTPISLLTSVTREIPPLTTAGSLILLQPPCYYCGSTLGSIQATTAKPVSSNATKSMESSMKVLVLSLLPHPAPTPSPPFSSSPSDCAADCASADSPLTPSVPARCPLPDCWPPPPTPPPPVMASPPTAVRIGGRDATRPTTATTGGREATSSRRGPKHAPRWRRTRRGSGLVGGLVSIGIVMLVGIGTVGLVGVLGLVRVDVGTVGDGIQGRRGDRRAAKRTKSRRTTR